MTRIPIVPPEEAEGRLAEVYEEIREARGAVANVYRIHSLLPESMLAHKDFYLGTLFSRGALSRPEREMIAVVVSAANDCAYCVQHHGDALDRYWKDRDRVEALARDPAGAELDVREMALTRYAVKLTINPEGVTDADVDALREAGVDDAGVLDATLVASYFNFVNRLVLGLDVELEDVTDDPRYEY